MYTYLFSLILNPCEKYLSRVQKNFLQALAYQQAQFSIFP